MRTKTILIEDLNGMPLWRWAAVISQLMREHGVSCKLEAKVEPSGLVLPDIDLELTVPIPDSDDTPAAN
jgi:hypothetical protein